MSTLRERAKKVLFIAVAIALLGGTLALAELIAGWTENVKLTRTETRTFLNQSAPLITTTHWLRPHLADEFINEQPDAELKRLLRTDSFGLVLGPPDIRYQDSVFVKQDVRYFMQQTLIFPPFRHRPLLGLTRLH